MSTSIIFASEEKKRRIREGYDRFLARLRLPFEERRFETRFGSTHALVAGPSSGEPLVLTHGALASSAHVLFELAKLAETRRIYALDVIGQSVMSEDRRVDLDGDDYGHWLADSADALGLERFDLVGISWGGFVALRAANLLGDRVSRLALLVPAGFVAGSAWAGFVKMGWPMLMYRAFPSEARLDRLVEPLFSTIDDAWKSYFGEAVRAYRLDMRIPPLAGPRDVAGLRCPVLVVAAEHDVSFPGRALLARAGELLPQAELELIEGAKHSPPMTEPFRCWLAARIERFYETHPLAGRSAPVSTVAA